METLTKENFWNAIEKKYPQAFTRFSAWIDQYREEMKFDALFGNFMAGYPNGRPSPQIKFHDLPWEFQTGVLARFQMECLHSTPPASAPNDSGRQFFEKNRARYAAECEMVFSDLQSDIKHE